LMDVRISPEAEVQLAERRAWWRANRDEVDVFDEDLALAVSRIGQSPTAFPWFGIRGGRLIRRCLMERASCHLYFEVDAAAAIVTIVLAWGAVREKPPSL
jgi:hypothetical protein